MSDAVATDTTPDESTKDLATLLAEEMARPSINAGVEPLVPLKLDTEPEWLCIARQAIEGSGTRAELNAVCAAFVGWPEERKVRIRPIRDARWAQLMAPTATSTHGVAVTAATAATVAAPVAPVGADADDVASYTAAAGRVTGLPVQPVAAGSDGAMHTVTTQVTPAPQETRPMVAGWRRIEAGPSAGKWGVCVEHLQYGVAIEPPVPGDVVLVNRARGGSQLKRIASIVQVGAARGGYSLCMVADPAPGERATLARPRGAAQPVPAHVTPTTASATQLAPSAPATSAAVVTPAPISELVADLGEIATEAAANATVADLGAQGPNAESSVEGRRLGVGFSTWQQYAEALRRGGLQPATRAEYLATVRRMGGTIDENTLPPANAPSALPVGAGIVHNPTGPSYFDRPREERRGFQVGRAAREVKTGAALLRAGDLIAGSIVGGAGGDFSWAGKGQITRAALLAALAEIGREGDAPAAKEARAQAGRAVDTLRPLGYHVHAVQGAERKSLPSHVAHRYIVGRALVQDAAAGIGEEYGKRVLVVDLHQDDTMHCTGDEGLASKVKADFEARCASDIYISADLTTWLQRTLRYVHGATRFGVGWYVPARQREEAERLTRAIAKIWGESWRHGMPVAACSHLFEGLVEGLSDEITKLEEAWAGAQEEAREARRERVGAAKAGGLLARIFETSERVRGYAVLLGDEIVAPLRARLATLDGAIRPLTDDTTARASMLEFS